jgi:hypothetical protein
MKCSDIDNKFHIVSYFYFFRPYLNTECDLNIYEIGVSFPKVRPVAWICSPSVQSYLDVIAFYYN